LFKILLILNFLFSLVSVCVLLIGLVCGVDVTKGVDKLGLGLGASFGVFTLVSELVVTLD
jgi:hypothetical protein